MPFYDEVLKEKNRIDQFVHQGFIISAVKEDLSGAWLEFTHPEGAESPVSLHIKTAEARTHFTNLLLKQARSA
jgi:hypothetical protein